MFILEFSKQIIHHGIYSKNLDSSRLAKFIGSQQKFIGVPTMNDSIIIIIIEVHLNLIWNIPLFQ